jgi:multidrug resistance efflux pump
MTVTIQHERGEQGRYYWVSAPLRVSLDGRDYMAARWSIAGIAIEEQLTPRPRAGQHVAVRVSLPFQGYDVSFSTSGVVEPVDTDLGGHGNAHSADGIIVRFDSLTSRDRDLLTHFLSDLVQGRMSAATDTMRRIDVPVAPTRLASDHATSSTDTYLRRPARSAAMSFGYLALGATLIGYLATLAYTNLAWIDVPAAAVNADIEPVHALGSGVITLTTFKIGSAVKAGDIVARIVDTDLERDIRLADIGVREREMRWRITNYQMLQRRYRRLDVPSPEKSDVNLAVDRQRELVAKRRDLEVKAPFDGIIAALPVGAKANIRRGDVVALFERSGPRREITAFLTAAELERVRRGGRALVRVPGEDRTIVAEIAEIVPNGGLLARMVRPAGEAPSPRPADRQADVRLVLNDQDSGGVVPGQAVFVMLERDAARRFVQSTAGLFGGVRKAVAGVTNRAAGPGAGASATPGAAPK